MKEVITRGFSEAEIHEASIYKERTKDTTFNKNAIQNLSSSDQYLFHRFGLGPITKLPYNLINKAFEAQVVANPNEIAVCHLGTSITYQELDNQANYLALELIQQGVKNGDNVGLFVQRSIPMVIGIIAILKAGAAYVPQHIGLAPDNQLNYVIEKADIDVILTISQFKELVPKSKKITETIVIDDFLAGIKDRNKKIQSPDIKQSKDDVCYIIFTSGTTGMPNGVQVTHSNLCNILLTEPGNLGMRPGLKVGQILSIAFDMSVWEILGALSNGANLVIRGKDIQETVSQVDIVISTPTILSSLDISKCKNVKVAAVAGEPCPRILAEQWSEFCAFYNSCGPTEVTIVNTASRFFHTDQILSIGRPMPNNTVYILDENLEPCPIGEPGEMWAGGLCVSKGYLQNETLNNERYKDDPFLGQGQKMFRTRDLGRWTEDGGLEHLGRTDDQVKVCGFRVELDSVTSIIEKMPQTKRAVTIKYDDRTLISFASPVNLNEDAIKAKIAESLPYYAVPNKVITLPELPMTSRGKIDKRELMNLLQSSEKTEKPVIQMNSATADKKSPTPDSESKQAPLSLESVVLPEQIKPSRRKWKGESLMHYYRLFGLMVLANVGILIYGVTSGNWWDKGHTRLDIISKITLVNFTIGILIRQQYIINFLFWIATSIPKSWPLSIRRKAGKVYHFGGLHIGGTVSGTFWYLIFTASLFYGFFNTTSGISQSLPLIYTTTVLSALLIYIIVMALPKMRAKFHNNFEQTHRFGGWTALILFWFQTILVIRQNNLDLELKQTLFESSNFWLLALITFSIALPWLRLKKVKVDITKPSNHVILARFNYGETPFAGSSTAISRNPLMEWHSFANVPEPGRDGFRLTISRAGDWTGQLIDDTPKHVWVKGITTAGVGNIDKLFKKVIWVATGSGIGPCLPHLLSQETPSLLVWATRNPRKTYGDELVDEILSVQPNAIIWDTDAFGKPDVVKLAYKAYKDFDAEAVICISNKKLTWKVVYGLESRNIPAYGAIWDS